MSIDATRQTTSASQLWERTMDGMGFVWDSFLDLVDPAEKKTEKTKDAEKDWVALGVEMTLRLAIAVTSSYLLTYMTRKFLTGMIDNGEDAPPSQQTVHARLSRILRQRRQRGGNTEEAKELPPLDSYERQMAQEILDPSVIQTTFQDVGGLDETKKEIYQLAVLPLLEPDLFQTGSQLVQPCKGILLFGKPGTGKTMLAKALAAEAQAVFIPLQLSKILNKWVGESNKLIAATFRLATKLQPAIIFIDELDTFLKSSAGNDTAPHLDSIKAEFLTLWDGVGTSSDAQVLVLGATNKPHAIDPAILRRMPRAFAVPLPNADGRLAILNLIFQMENMEPAARNFLSVMSSNRFTAGYSGSDLKELAKAAAMVPVQERTAEYARRQVMGETTDGPPIKKNTSSKSFRNTSTKPTVKISKQPLRPICKQDLLLALQKVRRSGAAAKEYGRQELLESWAEMEETSRMKKERFSSNHVDDDDAIPDM